MSFKIEILERKHGKITLRGSARTLLKRLLVEVACEGEEELVRDVEEAARSGSLEVLEKLRSKLTAIEREPGQLRIRLRGGDCVATGEEGTLSAIYGLLKELADRADYPRPRSTLTNHAG